MNVLVTGATGFLGLYIVERLAARGDRVRAFCRREIPELRRPEVEIFHGDIRNRSDLIAACRGMDGVIHTAALAGIGVDRRPYYETNVVGTENVLAGCLISGVERLVHTSSPSITDGGLSQRGIDETTPFPKKHLAWYPETKEIAERRVIAANGAAFASDVPAASRGKLLTCALRPRLIWGPRDRQLVPRLIDRARRGRLARIGDGTNLLDTIYVENAADAHLRALDRLTPGSTVAGNAYYLTQGEPVNCWDWIDRVLAMADLPPVKKAISFRTAWRIGLFYETLYRLFNIKGDPPMTRFLATQLAGNYWFNISKAKRDLDYQPTISTEEGMRRLERSLKAA